MTLRKKAIIFLFLFFGIWFLLNAAVVYSVMFGSFSDIEHKRFERTIDRVQSGIDNLIAKHEALLADWSEWDDAYEYVQNPNEAFERAIYESDHFEKQHMNYYILYGEDYEVLDARGYDLEKGVGKPVPQSLIDLLPKYKNRPGLLYIDGVPVVFVTSEVTNNAGTGEPKGLFAFVYEVNDSVVNKLTEDIKEDVSIVADYDVANYQDAYTINHEKGEAYYGILYYKYDNVDANFVIRVEFDQEIRRIGQTAIYRFMYVFFFSVIILIMIITYTMNRNLLKIEKMGHDLSKINLDGHLTERVDIEGSDELGGLRDSINSLLDELQDAHVQLTHHASFDDLTGVYNRRAGLEKLEDEIHKLTAIHKPLTIVFTDVNGLKHVNDTFGHHTGDDYLIHICHSIKMVTSLDDTMARLGGDEFLVIFPYKTQEEVKALFEPVHEIIQNIHDEYSLPYQMGVSAGIFQYEEGMDVNYFIEQADRLMYEAKMARRMGDT